MYLLRLLRRISMLMMGMEIKLDERDLKESQVTFMIIETDSLRLHILHLLVVLQRGLVMILLVIA